MSEYLQETLI